MFKQFSSELKSANKSIEIDLVQTIKRGLRNATIQRTFCSKYVENKKIDSDWFNSQSKSIDTQPFNADHYCNDEDEDEYDTIRDNNSLLNNKNNLKTNSNDFNSCHRKISKDNNNGGSGVYEIIDDVYMSIDGVTNIVLKSINLVSIIDIRVIQLECDMETMSMPAVLNLGTISIECIYQTTNQQQIQLIPSTQIGKLTLTLENLRATGIIGLYFQGDHFVPTLNNFQYRTTEINVRVNYSSHVGVSNKQFTSEVISNDIDTTIVSKFWKQLTCFFNSIILNQFSEILREISILEKLFHPDMDLTAELRLYSSCLTNAANLIVDTICSNVKPIVRRVLNTDPIPKMCFTCEKLESITDAEHQQQWITFSTSPGQLSRMQNIQRKTNACLTDLTIDSFTRVRIKQNNLNEIYEKETQINIQKRNKDEDRDKTELTTGTNSINQCSAIADDAVVNCRRNSNDIYLYAIVQLTDLKLSYENYNLSLANNISTTGSIAINLNANQSLIKCRLGQNNLNGNVTVSVDEFQFLKFKPTEINLTGLGALNNLTDIVGHWSLSTFNQCAVPKLENEIKRALTIAAEQTNISNLFLDNS